MSNHKNHDHEHHAHSMEHNHSGHEHTHQHHKTDQKLKHEHHDHKSGGPSHHDHHAHMVAEFRKRFWISLVLTIPILILSPMLQKLVGFGESLRFSGDLYISFIFSSVVFFYGGWPFSKGLYNELKIKTPGMMTLIARAISVAYFYSSTVVFGLAGKVFFWELVTLIDIMLLGHWIEMRSVMGASRALEALAQLMPSDAHKIMPDGSILDIPLN